MTEKDSKLERAYLKTVLDVISRQLERLAVTADERRDGLIRERRYMWEELPHNIRSLEDAVRLSNQDQEVASAERAYLAEAAEIRRLDRMRRSPYFGRFDFTEDGGTARESVYIGAGNLMDEDSYDIYVYDWRAPVCSVFYEYEPDETHYAASYETPDGIRKIRLLLKRQYKIEDGGIAYMYDTNSSMHDDILGRILSKNTSNRLKVIISSIQREQNAAIRNPRDRFMLIYGLAGSGKTSVGLHRMAYILYRHRGTIRSGDIVVLSNNAIFNSYISNILPELGEDDITRILFYDLISAAAKGGFTFENHIGQLSALDKEPGGERAGDVRLKYSREFLDFCVGYFKTFRFVVPELRYRDKVILSKEAFQSKWDGLRFSGFRATLDNIVETIRQYYEDYFTVNKKAVMEDIVRDSDIELSERAVGYHYEARLGQHIANAVREVADLNGADTVAQLDKILTLFAEKHGIPESFAAGVMRSFEEKHVLYEDALLYLLVSVLTGETAPSPNVAHVLVDEAQDYSLLQLYIVRALYPKSYFTLLADVNQTVSDLTSVGRYEDFELVFGAALQRFRLEKCYRSSGPINALAFQLIGRCGGRPTEGFSYFNREGEKPRWIVTQSLPETIARLLTGLSGYNLIGIVTGGGDAAAIHRSLGGGDAAQLVTEPQDEITERVVVLPLALAKGLEFDAVILVGCFRDGGNEAAERRRAYLGCTRALHELFIVDAAPLPDRFADCAPFIVSTTG